MQGYEGFRTDFLIAKVDGPGKVDSPGIFQNFLAPNMAFAAGATESGFERPKMGYLGLYTGLQEGQDECLLIIQNAAR